MEVMGSDRGERGDFTVRHFARLTYGLYRVFTRCYCSENLHLGYFMLAVNETRFLASKSMVCNCSTSIHVWHWSKNALRGSIK